MLERMTGGSHLGETIAQTFHTDRSISWSCHTSVRPIWITSGWVIGVLVSISLEIFREMARYRVACEAVGLPTVFAHVGDRVACGAVGLPTVFAQVDGNAK